MSHHAGALAVAGAQVAAVRDDPAARLALMSQVFRGPTGRAPRHLPFRQAALSFMRWQARRGVLNPLDASPPGSVWWRAINERLLRDGCENGRAPRRVGRRALVAGRAALAGVRRETDQAQLVSLALDVDRYVADEQRLGRMLDYAVIAPRLPRLYEWDTR